MPSSPISPCPSCPPPAAGGHGCAVYSSSVTDAEWAILEPLLPAPGSTAAPRRTTRNSLPPRDSGRHPVHRARWYRVAATAGGVPASRDGVRGLRPLGPQRGVAAHPRRAARPTDELVRANVGDLRRTDDGAVIQVRGKGGKDRRIPIEPALMQVLERYLDSRPLPCRRQAALLPRRGTDRLAGGGAAVRGRRR